MIAIIVWIMKTAHRSSTCQCILHTILASRQEDDTERLPYLPTFLETVPGLANFNYFHDNYQLIIN